MARYAAVGVSAGSVAAGSPESALAVMQPGSGMVKPGIYEIIIGCSTSAVDTQVTHVVQRISAAGSGGTTPTPEPLDPDNPKASVCTTRSGHTGEPTYTGAAWLQLALHLRSTFRWVARQPDGNLFIKATASHGAAHKRTTAGSGTPALTTTMHWDE